MRIECPHCGQTGQMTDSAVGKTVRCPKCDKRFRVDDTDGPEVPGVSKSTRLVIITIVAALVIGAGLAFTFLLYQSASEAQRIQDERNKWHGLSNPGR
jgi:uncharacterized protein (DUF983 family)